MGQPNFYSFIAKLQNIPHVMEIKNLHLSARKDCFWSTWSTGLPQSRFTDITTFGSLADILDQVAIHVHSFNGNLHVDVICNTANINKIIFLHANLFRSFFLIFFPLFFFQIICIFRLEAKFWYFVRLLCLFDRNLSTGLVTQ